MRSRRFDTRAIRASDRCSHVLLAGFIVAVVLLSGCALRFQLLPGGEGEGSADDVDGSMTQSRMESIFADEVEAIVGPRGAIQTRVDGITVYLISDSTMDRMRFVAPIRSATDLPGRVVGILIQANFGRTRDARYAVSDGVVYAVFLHPISSLSPDLIRSALSQVLSLVRTFGTSYSAGNPHAAIKKKNANRDAER